MFKLFIIILLLTINLCYAQELEQPQPLVFVNKNNYSLSFISNNYRVAGNEYNKFLTGEQYCELDIEEWNNQYNAYYMGDSNYDYYHLNRDGSDKFDHEFNGFITGKKYCKRGSTNWDEQCQDAVMHHVYGENWREFKRVALEFQQALIAGDRWGAANLCAMPLLYDVLDYRGTDQIGVGYFIIGYYWQFIEKYQELLSKFANYIHRTKYQDFSFGHINDRVSLRLRRSITLQLNKEYFEIEFQYRCNQFKLEHNQGNFCNFLPRIAAIHINTNRRQ